MIYVLQGCFIFVIMNFLSMTILARNILQLRAKLYSSSETAIDNFFDSLSYPLSIAFGPDQTFGTTNEAKLKDTLINPQPIAMSAITIGVASVPPAISILVSF